MSFQICIIISGIIHGDAHDENILVQETSRNGEKHYDICGIIDFGEVMSSYLVFEVAITICYISIECKCMDHLDVGGHILAGYMTQIELSREEFDALKVLVAARYCTELLLGAHAFSIDPSNDYLIKTSYKGWPQLRKLWQTPNEELCNNWRSIMHSYG